MPPRFFDFFHRTFEDFFEDNGHPYRHCLAVERIGWPAVYTQAEFKSPIRFGDTLSTIAQRYRIPQSRLREINLLPDANIMAGDLLIVPVIRG